MASITRGSTRPTIARQPDVLGVVRAMSGQGGANQLLIRRSGGRLASVCVIGLLGVLAAVAVNALGDERCVTRAQAQLIEQSRATAAGYATPVELLPPVPECDNPRARLAHATLLARAALVAPDNPQRDTTLLRAATEIDDLLTVRRHWPEAMVVGAAVAAARGRRDEALTRLARSYRAAGYLHEAAAWRVGFTFDNWEHLPADTRAHAVDEAVWLARSNRGLYDEIFARARVSGAYQPMLMRWRHFRLPDMAVQDDGSGPPPRPDPTGPSSR